MTNLTISCESLWQGYIVVHKQLNVSGEPVSLDLDRLTP